MNPRHYYRCADCLGVCATGQQERGRVECGACGGTLEYMGRVQRDRLVKDELRCPCDSRCTNAPGPSCECRCGGANHGTGLVVEFQRDCGPVPVAKMRNAPTLQREAGIYRGLVDAIKAHLQTLKNGYYRETEERRLYSARQMRSHHGRNARLREMMKRHGISEPLPTWQDQPAAEWNTTTPASTTRGSQASLFAR